MEKNYFLNVGTGTLHRAGFCHHSPVNIKWFETEEISCPNIKDDTSYELAESNHKIRVVNYLNVDKIYKDLFEKLGRN